MEQEQTDVFQQACLIQLSTSVWMCSKVIDRSILNQLGENSEWLNGRKYLINPDLLLPVRQAVYKARKVIEKYALPFPIKSIYLIPKELLTTVDRNLQNKKNLFLDRVYDFEAVYDSAREEAREMLGDLFNEADYPMAIRSKFSFEWRFLTLDVPGKSSILPPELYEKEKKKFQAMMAEARNLAGAALREEFGSLVEHLTNRMNKKTKHPQVLKPSMFDKLQEFMDDFDARNIFKDHMLNELIEQTRDLIKDINEDGLKPNNVMRKKLKDGMNALKTAIDGAIEDMPRRNIRMAV